MPCKVLNLLENLHWPAAAKETKVLVRVWTVSVQHRLKEFLLRWCGLLRRLEREGHYIFSRDSHMIPEVTWKSYTFIFRKAVMSCNWSLTRLHFSHIVKNMGCFFSSFCMCNILRESEELLLPPPPPLPFCRACVIAERSVRCREGLINEVAQTFTAIDVLCQVVLSCVVLCLL